MRRLLARSRWLPAALLLQLTALAVAYWGAWLLRFDFVIPATELPLLDRGLGLLIVTKMATLFALGFFAERWFIYQSFHDVFRLLRNHAAASLASGIVIGIFLGQEFPRSVYLLDFLLALLMGGGIVFAVRLMRELRFQWQGRHGRKPVVIYGAGVAGVMLAREIRSNPNLASHVVGFLDDDPRKAQGKLMGLPIFGSGLEAPRILKVLETRGQKISEILVAMPSANSKQIRAAVDRGRAAGVKCTAVPGLGELISGKLSAGRKLETSVNELLGRKPVDTDLDSVRRKTAGRSVLVTGAAGSIGTELCMQLAALDIRKLVALDQAESELFRLEADLRAKFPDLDLIAEVGDIRDARQMEQVIEQHAVNSIYHAAAYKHVPLMERQACEAVRNNVVGTWNLVQAAVRLKVSDFLLISSDKAVNPTSIMGLTKRVAELLVSARRIAGGSVTKFVSVRFGNVLVSNGSVVPIFQKQIAAGGPVTVTDPEIRRFFMTVQEAVQLVLQASTMGKGSEIFVLDMGQPVKIVDLARNMILQAGFIPGEEIDIRFTGLRPGEKIFEELNLDDELISPTTHPGIFSFGGKQMSLAELAPWMATLQHLLWRRDAAAMIEHIRELVPEYLGPKLKPTPAAAPATAIAKVRMQTEDGVAWKSQAALEEVAN